MTFKALSYYWANLIFAESNNVIISQYCNNIITFFYWVMTFFFNYIIGKLLHYQVLQHYFNFSPNLHFRWNNRFGCFRLDKKTKIHENKSVFPDKRLRVNMPLIQISKTGLFSNIIQYKCLVNVCFFFVFLN